MRSAEPASRFSRPAKSITSVLMPGTRTDAVIPDRNEYPITCHSCIESVKMRAASDTDSKPRIVATPLTRSRLPKRSISTPPMGANRNSDTPPTPAVAPTQNTESLTSSASQP